MTTPPLSMRRVRQAGLGVLFALLTFAVGPVAILSVASTDALAQDNDAAAGRFVVVLDVTGKYGHKISDEFRTMFRAYPHVVFTQGEYVEAGQRNSVRDERFWDTPSLMSEVSRAEGIDAVVAGHLERDRRKRYTLTVFVLEARTGEIVGEFSMKLGKKLRLRDKTLDEIAEMANALIVDIPQPAPEPTTVQITIDSQPQGATVLREGKSLGTTPLTTTVDLAQTEEVWELTWDNQPAGIVRVDLAADSRYVVPLTDVEVSDGGGGGSSAGAFDTGGGLPVFEIGVSTDITGRSLEVETSDPNVGLSYSSSPYPVFMIEAAFFPLTLFVDDPYVGGIGVKAYGGFGTLQSRIPVIANGPVLTPETTECGGTESPDLIECPTDHSEFGFGATYRLLLQDDENGQPDAEGMALGFDLTYTWLVFDVGTNPTYEGHGYQGLEIGAGYSTPLVLPELRLDAALAYTQGLTFGDASMIANWGQSASGWGMGWGLEVGYEIFAGLFAQVGYGGKYFSTTYDGIGCQGFGAETETGCAINTESSAASDQYHRGILRVGYRLH